MAIAFISANRMAVQESVGKILTINHGSGADALAGFIGAFVFWKVEARI